MKKILAAVSAFGLPLFVFAQQIPINNLTTTRDAVVVVLNYIVAILVALAVFWVIWGAFQFVLASGDEEKRKEGKNKILYGIIGIFIMLSVYGLVNILVGTFKLSTNNVSVPQIKVPVGTR